MPTNFGKGDKKKTLLAYKDKLLQEIKYLDQRIHDTLNSVSKADVFEEYDSSDSEVELPQPDCGPSLPQLRKTERMLETCLQATKELTSLNVVQFETTVMVEPPEITGEPPVTDPGTWREVMAECSIDLIPFSITFYVHKPHRKFAPTSYRGLRVIIVKKSHEAELAASVLPTLKRPSDAVEVIRSYSVAYRSRRSTLARLTDKFGTALNLKPVAEGGYQLCCSKLLEISWTVLNKWSPIAPFHHKMKFDLEYMDEEYVKAIAIWHKQLSEPNIDTDERTLLLARIIAKCLEARGIESGCEEREVMAPPKSLPKKVKPKEKETTANQNKTQNATTEERKSMQRASKRSILDENTKDNSKRMKTSKENAKSNKAIDKIDDGDVIDKVASEINDQKAVTDKENAKNAKKAVNNEQNGTKSTKSKKSNQKTVEKDGANTVVDEKGAQKVVSNQKVNQKGVTKEKSSLKNANSEKSNKNVATDIKNDQNAKTDEKDGPETVASEKHGQKIVNTVKNSKIVASDKKNELNAKTDGKSASKAVNDKISQKKIVNDKNGQKIVADDKNKNSNVDGNNKDPKKVDAEVQNKKANDAHDKNTNKTVKNSNINSKNPVSKDSNKESTTKATAQSAENTKNNVKNKNTAPVNNNDVKTVDKDKQTDKNTNAKQLANKNIEKNDGANANIDKPSTNPSKSGKVIKPTNKIASENGGTVKKVDQKTAEDKTKDITTKTTKTVLKKPTTVKNIIASNSNENLPKNVAAIPKNNVANAKITAKTNLKLVNSQKPLSQNGNKLIKPTNVKTGKVISTNLKKISPVTEKENKQNKISKIPQIKSSTPKGFKKMPSRISPRKSVSKFKPTLAGPSTKVVSKTTNIPRLFSKPKIT